MRILFAGTPATACPTLAALDDDPRHEVVAVLTRPDAAQGRHRTPRPSPVAVEAGNRNIPVIRAASVRSGQAHDLIAALDVDIAVVVAYGGLIPADLLEAPRHGWINLHFSVLPRWRGAAPVQRAIMAGDRSLGATVFQLVEELDAGPVYTSASYPLRTDDTAGSVLKRLSHDATVLVTDALTEIGNGEQPEPQPDEGITTAPKLTTDDARIDPSWHAVDIDRLVRGTSPAPGAWAELDGERFKVLLTRVWAQPVDLAPGELRADKKHLLMGAGGGAVELLTVQPFGRRAMPGADWARGANLAPGTRLD
ncbi:Methionyl-tRNA formyltransferase [Acidipropionibacterium acidipropionici ATCC 4875]|uniref:Methionyl-tRNA formyltransferase n=1 Tax=Acidipropionibacterium acidipropionici (strain ATCC 4875 / DSM 20272 / JCM 6432 / NBRC 12425 / NCIMB 8070 / 4) TaxID=1171373 RepID=K7S4M6_ACIA4|nr:methionyl-tRNA formyltransferase [Acidipropionibacterium acidipropionici]AFV89562.1 Methionyl-tRNA formyltransferase [Acidipropionibacterium acidipropionici ATCC 4875]